MARAGSLPRRRSSGAGQPRKPVWQHAAWRCLALLLAVVLVYAPALGGGFLWDDASLISGNRLIKSPVFFLEAFRHRLFLESPSLHYRPFQTLSYLLDYWCWGNNPFGYHLTNILLHGASAGLLYLLLCRWLAVDRRVGVGPGNLHGKCGDNTATPRWTPDNGAFFAALLWAVHPSHNAAVAYVAGRADSLAFIFAALGWLCLLPSTAAGGPGEFLSRSVVPGAAGAFCLFCALASRESAICWIVILALGFAFFTPRAGRRDFWRLGLAVTLALGAYGGLRFNLPPLGPTPPAPDFDPLARLLLCFRALGGYLQILCWPVRLVMDRQLGCEQELLEVAGASHRLRHWLAVDTLIGVGLIAALIYGCCRRGAGRGWRRFGSLWFLVAFLPVSNLFPLNASIAEHWLYLPSVGLLLVGAGWWREWVPRALACQWRRVAFAAALLGVAAVLGARTFSRSTDWVDARTFYARNMANGGDSLRVCYNYAAVCYRQGDLPEAERVLVKLLQRDPGDLSGKVLLDRIAAHRDPPTLEEHMHRLWTLRGEARARGTPGAHAQELQLTVRLAELLTRSNQPGPALTVVQEQIAAAPPDEAVDWQLLALRSDLLVAAGRLPEALAAVEAFAYPRWWHQDARLRVADLQLKLGRIGPAMATLAAADRLDVRDATALNQLAVLHLGAGDATRALACQRAALAKAPRLPRQHQLLGALYAHLQRGDEARQQFQIAARLQGELAARVPADQRPLEKSRVN